MAQARVVDNKNLGANLTFINVFLTDVIRMQYGTPHPSASKTNAFLRHQDDLISGIRTIFIADSHGRIIRSDRQKIIGFDRSGRDYFKAALTVSDPARLIITPPFQTLLGTSVVNVTRKVTGKRGDFIGIVSTSLDRNYFSTLLRSVLYTSDNRVSLVHSGREVFISLSDTQAGFAGNNLVKSGSLFQRHRESGKQISIQLGRSSMLGYERIEVFITCKPPDLHVEYPLVISVSRSRDAILAPWQRDTDLFFSFYIFLCGISKQLLVAYDLICFELRHIFIFDLAD